MKTAPPIGSRVALNRLVSYEKPADLEQRGVVKDHQTKRVVTVVWDRGAHQTVRIDRLDFA